MAKKTLSQKKLGRKFVDRIEIREFSDLARLTDEELQIWHWRRVWRLPEG